MQQISNYFLKHLQPFIHKTNIQVSIEYRIKIELRIYFPKPNMELIM